MNKIHVILTRPAGADGQWSQIFSDLGHPVTQFPLIEIAALPWDVSLIKAWEALPRYKALMMVSRAAVQHFWARGQHLGDATSPDLMPLNEEKSFKNNTLISSATRFTGRFWVTGPGSAEQLGLLGVDSKQIDMPDPRSAQIDSEHLWDKVRHQVQVGDQILLVRGRDSDTQQLGRDWLRQVLLQVGAIVDEVTAYERISPAADAQRLASLSQLRALKRRAVWVFGSNRALANLQHLLPDQSWKSQSAICTHERVAQTAKELGFGVVILSQPSPQAVFASIKSLDASH